MQDQEEFKRLLMAYIQLNLQFQINQNGKN